ncbi:hypothetical protein [Chryseobacterium sp. T1]
MNNDLETIKKIKDFFENMDVKSENIVSTIMDLNKEENVLKRYLKKIKENCKTEKKLDNHNNNNYKINEHSTFCVIYETKELLNALEDIFGQNISFSKQFNTFCIKSSQSKLFLEIWALFRDKVKWRSLSDERRFHWTYENIDKGIEVNIWEWEDLSKNPALPWNFDFIEKYKDFLHWKYIKANNKLYWSEQLIEKYYKYIFESDNITYRDDLTFCEDIINKWKVEFERNENVDWNYSIIEKHKNFLDFQLLSKNSKILFDDYLIQKYGTKLDLKHLSQVPNINLSSNLILEFAEFWDWEEILRNESFKFNFEIIESQKNILDWNFVNIHPHLFWDKNFIDKYSEYIFNANSKVNQRKTPYSPLESFCKKYNQTGYFESNNNVFWDDELIDTYKDIINWEYLSANQSIFFSINQLEKYKEYLNWDIFFQKGNTTWNEEVIDKYIDKSTSKNLVSNKNISWNVSMFKKYVKNQDAWILSDFCKNANISKDVIKEFQTFWSQISISNSHRFKFSDFGNYTEYIYNSLWKDLFRNNNIIWDDDLVESCLENIVLNEMLFFNGKLTVDFINKYWDFSKVENVWRVGNYDEGTYEETCTVFLRDKLQYCEITDLDLPKFINNEFKWLGSSLNNYSLNKSLENLVLNECEKRNIR